LTFAGKALTIIPTIFCIASTSHAYHILMGRHRELKLEKRSSLRKPKVTKRRDDSRKASGGEKKSGLRILRKTASVVMHGEEADLLEAIQAIQEAASRVSRAHPNARWEMAFPEDQKLVEVEVVKPGKVRVRRRFFVVGRSGRERDEIIDRVTSWAGSKAKAERWFRSEPIPALGDQTAEGLVRTGQASLVREYLDAIAAGGFA